MRNLVTDHRLAPRSVVKQHAFTKLDFFRTAMMLKLLVLGAFMATMSLFYIWSRIQIVNVGYQINEHLNEQELLQQENKEYQMELALMKSPQRLQQLATEKLGLVVPADDRIRTLTPKDETP